jgi:nitroreductase
MNTFEAVKTRRSVRNYQEQKVPEEIVMELLQAAMCGPSAGNQQPWQFIVIDDRKVLDSLLTANPNAKMCKEAQLAILVCGDLTKEKYPGFWVQDCSAAVMSILLVAHSRGLGAVWTGVYPIQERVDGFRRLLHLPDTVMPLALVPMGYPAKDLPHADRFQPDRVHRNRW